MHKEGWVGLPKEWVIERLMENVNRAMQAQEVCNAGSVANKALELLGKELGMFIEPKEVAIKFSHLTDEEVRQQLIEEGQKLGIPDPESLLKH